MRERFANRKGKGGGVMVDTASTTVTAFLGVSAKASRLGWVAVVGSGGEGHWTKCECLHVLGLSLYPRSLELLGPEHGSWQNLVLFGPQQEAESHYRTTCRWLGHRACVLRILMQGLGFREGLAGCILGDFRRDIWEGIGENTHPQPSVRCTCCQAFLVHTST